MGRKQARQGSQRVASTGESVRGTGVTFKPRHVCRQFACSGGVQRASTYVARRGGQSIAAHAVRFGVAIRDAGGALQRQHGFSLGPDTHHISLAFIYELLQLCNSVDGGQSPPSPFGANRWVRLPPPWIRSKSDRTSSRSRSNPRFPNFCSTCRILKHECDMQQQQHPPSNREAVSHRRRHWRNYHFSDPAAVKNRQHYFATDVYFPCLKQAARYPLVVDSPLLRCAAACDLSLFWESIS